jgi:hypothetical protein
MNEKMAESAHIDVERLRKIAEGEAVDTRKIVKKAYYNAVSLPKGYDEDQGRKVNAKKAKRVVESWSITSSRRKLLWE